MLARVLIAAIRLYQLTLSKVLFALLGPVCRFEPSCSRYAVACLSSHGALRGTLLSLKRLCRCHPFHPGGFDPPPLPRPRAPERRHLREATDRSLGAANAPLHEPGEPERTSSGPRPPTRTNEATKAAYLGLAPESEGLHEAR